MTEDKVLEKVRKLLAKAAGTGFGPEAESFLEKAQELMLRHAIDQSQLEAGHIDKGKATSVILTASHAYSRAQVLLIHGISRALGLSAITLPARRGQGDHRVEVFGFEDDLNFMELLYTDLLVQSYRDCEREYRTGAGRSWKNSFLIAFAQRVEIRLAKQQGRAKDTLKSEGFSVDLVLYDRSKLADQAMHEKYPSIKIEKYRTKTDFHGMARGAAAGDRADINAGRNGVKGRSKALGR